MSAPEFDRAFEATLDVLVASASAGTPPDVLARQVPGMYAAFVALAGAAAASAGEDAPAPFEPAVSVRKSLASPDHILSMIDGRPYKTLRRHLSTHGLTPAEYRERYGLKDDYPMVAASYSAARRDMAKRIGLGRKPAATADA